VLHRGRPAFRPSGFSSPKPERPQSAPAGDVRPNSGGPRFGSGFADPETGIAFRLRVIEPDEAPAAWQRPQHPRGALCGHRICVACVNGVIKVAPRCLCLTKRGEHFI